MVTQLHLGGIGSHTRSRGRSISPKFDQPGNKTEYSRVDTAPHGEEPQPRMLANRLVGTPQRCARRIEAYQNGTFSVVHGKNRFLSPIHGYPESLQHHKHVNNNDDLPLSTPPRTALNPNRIGLPPIGWGSDTRAAPPREGRVSCALQKCFQIRNDNRL